MKGVTVAVTGMNAKPDNPGPGLAVARCLRESEGFEGRIVGLGYDVLDPGLYLREQCDAGYLLPYPSAGEAALLERLRAIQARESIDILIPCLDAELLGFARLMPELEQMGIRCLLPDVEQLQQRNKDRLGDLAASAGLDYPQTKPVTHAGFFYQCQQEGWHYPLVVKGQFYDAAVAHNPDQAAHAFRRIANEWGLPVLVQQFVQGEEVNLTGVGDGEGGLHGVVMMRKRAMTDKGKAWAGISIWDERLLQAAEALVASLRWPGPLEVEVLRDANGRYCLVEINPRFPAWIYLSHGVGRNLPRLLVDLINGTPRLFFIATGGTAFYSLCPGDPDESATV
ncbi:ATP-grasp domain-containing protein [endosymbiont of Tevnia jerichonana]|uniref:ATP-grasp domain-containing protein n=1 Tax=endosymbiont of Tevnia jerichonana TaxID=94785 RepID=UPI001F120EE5|nr:ATP-grasp domain-containing protein [endosymbiont of Tevnia jerichonana]